jgi:hypothetical protein
MVTVAVSLPPVLLPVMV